MSSKAKKRCSLKRGDCWLGGMWRRAGLLVVAVAFGIFLAKCVSPWLLCFLGSGVHDAVKAAVGAATFTSPIFLTLWWFRTYDSRQQLQRANFEAGVGLIASDTPIRIEIGTQILLEVSKVTSAFDIEIALTFVKRLKRYPAETAKNEGIVTGGYRWGYAQHMLKWLANDYERRNKKRDLENLNLRNQEFTNTEAQITIFEVLEMHTGESLTADVTGCDDDIKSFLGNCSDIYTKWHIDNEDNRIERARRKKHNIQGSFKPRIVEVTVPFAYYHDERPDYSTDE